VENFDSMHSYNPGPTTPMTYPTYGEGLV